MSISEGMELQIWSMLAWGWAVVESRSQQAFDLVLARVLGRVPDILDRVLLARLAALKGLWCWLL